MFALRLLSSLLPAVLGLQGPPRPPNDSIPAPTNVSGAQYPRITADLKVIFRIKSPDAQKVEPPGTEHEWLTWRRSLHEFAPLLFQAQKPAGSGGGAQSGSR